MQLNQTEIDGVGIIRLKGIVSQGELHQIDTVVKRMFDRSIIYFIINLVDVTDLSSSGMGKLYELQEKIIERHGQLFLCDLSGVCEYVLKLAGLSKQFNILKTEEEALKILRRNKSTKPDPKTQGIEITFGK